MLGPGTQRTNIVNIMRFALRNPSAAAVMLRKVAKRFDPRGRRSDRNWMDAHRRSSAEYARAHDPRLWNEAAEFGAAFRRRVEPIIARIPFDMGGGGDYEFLYWLTRRLKPEVVVETGVSAGWSSNAFLTAMERNGTGKLYSSDFPYFRVKDPEKYIGIVVDPHLKSRWELHVDGDEKALRRILAKVPSVDLFHYDSDKSYSGRDFAVSLVWPRLTGPLLMDDIVDNDWFRRFAVGKRFTILDRTGMIVPPGSE